MDSSSEDAFTIQVGKPETPKRRAPKVPLPRPPTDRQRRYVARLAAHGNKTQAALDAGYSPGTRPDVVERSIRNTTLVSELDAVGVTDRHLAEKLKHGMDAKRGFRTGKESYIMEDDYATQFKFVKLGFDLRGHNPAHNNHGKAPNVVFDMRSLLVGAFKIMGKSAGVSVDEEKIAAEIVELTSSQDPQAPLKALEAQASDAPDEDEDEDEEQ